jgi:hypothetical protein
MEKKQNTYAVSGIVGLGDPVSWSVAFELNYVPADDLEDAINVVKSLFKKQVEVLEVKVVGFRISKAGREQ